MPLFFVWLKHSCTLAVWTPGVGIWQPRRKTATMSSTNSSFLRRSGVRNALANAPSTCSSFAGAAEETRSRSRPDPGPIPGRAVFRTVGTQAVEAEQARALAHRGGGTSLCPAQTVGSALGGRTAGSRDLLDGRGRELVRRDL